jgi:hypothetical protein
MTKWKYRSLEWIHRVREQNYLRTKDKDLEEVMKESVKRTKKET